MFVAMATAFLQLEQIINSKIISERNPIFQKNHCNSANKMTETKKNDMIEVVLLPTNGQSSSKVFSGFMKRMRN